MKPFNGSCSSSLVQLLNWIFRPLDDREECRRKYGDTLKLNLMGLPPLMVVSDRLGVQEIFAVDAQKFDVGRTNGLVSSLKSREFSGFIGWRRTSPTAQINDVSFSWRKS